MSGIDDGSFNSVTNNLAGSEVKAEVFYSFISCKSKVGDSQHFWHNQTEPVRRNVNYLRKDNLHKMIQRFLTEKGMSKEELAKVLEITVKNLEQLFDPEIPAGLLCRINLPLVSLYCRTNWE